MAVSAMIAGAAALAGAAAFSLINLMLLRWSAEKRKRCGECVRQPSESETPGSGLAIAAGSMHDAVPEALIIGAAAAGGTNTLPPIAPIGDFPPANLHAALPTPAVLPHPRRTRRPADGGG